MENFISRTNIKNIKKTSSKSTLITKCYFTISIAYIKVLTVGSSSSKFCV